MILSDKDRPANDGRSRHWIAALASFKDALKRYHLPLQKLDAKKPGKDDPPG